MGGESEELLGRWRRSRGVGDEIVVATKVGGRPTSPARDFSSMERLTPEVIRSSAERSLDRLGLPRIDLFYAHVQDGEVPLEDQVAALAAWPPTAPSGCWV